MRRHSAKRMRAFIFSALDRHHHTFDPFPDMLRVIPFGTGACVYYNYVDLRFHNPTDLTFQVHVRVAEEHLKGSLYADREWPLTYRLQEREHRFVRTGDKVFRENEVWRLDMDRATNKQVGEERLMRNFCEVKYGTDGLGLL